MKLSDFDPENIKTLDAPRVVHSASYKWTRRVLHICHKTATISEDRGDEYCITDCGRVLDRPFVHRYPIKEMRDTDGWICTSCGSLADFQEIQEPYAKQVQEAEEARRLWSERLEEALKTRAAWNGVGTAIRQWVYQDARELLENNPDQTFVLTISEIMNLLSNGHPYEQVK